MNYSLIELAIVLLISSLLLTFGFATVNLLEKQRLKSFIYEINATKKDFMLFKERYDYFPGDFPHANKIWPDKCNLVDIENFNQCNGNADEYINDVKEGSLAWTHLNFAGFNDFLPNYANNVNYAKAGYNINKSKYIKSDIQILGDTKLHIININIKDIGRNFLRFAKSRNRGNILDSILSPMDSFMIDKKIDDSYPVTGKLIADMGSREFSNYKKQYCIEENEENKFFYRKFESKIYCYIQISL